MEGGEVNGSRGVGMPMEEKKEKVKGGELGGGHNHGAVLTEEEKVQIMRTSQVLWHARKDDEVALRGLLMQEPALSKAHDYDGRTALHVAAIHNCLRAASILLKFGAPINAQDRWGSSPLADAEGAKHLEMAKFLKDHGGYIMGSHGSHLDSKIVGPPVSQNCDWEIDFSEIDDSKKELIGKGSFGEIWKASWRGTPVAIKKILPALSNDKLVIQDFRHEVELLVGLRHPNIVQFLGVITTRQRLMFITEYLQGGDLHSFLKVKGPLQANMAVNFALDIARGMAYLHSGSNVIIHRDLKPRNVLLVDANHLKVGDFGLSKLIKVKNLHEAYKMTGETGSYRYMAPEVFSHKPYDAKVDVFSFGMILYEMFEGITPFADDDPYEAAHRVANSQRPQFRAKTYPQDLKPLIRECWDGNADRRPSFMEIINKLEDVRKAISNSDSHHHHHHHWPFLHNHNHSQMSTE